MPLFVSTESSNETMISLNEYLDEKLIQAYPHLINIPDNVVYVPTGSKVLYIHQNEIAKNVPQGIFDFIGSDDTTTCHIVLAKSRSSTSTNRSNILVTHIGGRNSCRNLHLAIDELGDDLIDVFIMGGIDDNLSKEITSALLKELQQSHRRVCLQLLHVNHYNIYMKDNKYPCPKVYGFGFHGTSMEVSFMSFPMTTRGPEIVLREAIMFSHEITSKYHINPDLLCVFDGRKDLYFRIPYFKVSLSPEYLSYFLEISDEEILIHLSTSPFVEPKHFVDKIKQTLIFIQKYLMNDEYFGIDKQDLLYQQLQDVDSTNQYHWMKMNS